MSDDNQMRGRQERSFYFEEALLPNGWSKGVRVQVSREGVIIGVQESSLPLAGDIKVSEPSCPGVSNLHSHSFQRAIAGRTATRQKNSQDHFWTWRDAMYRAALRLSPEDLSAIAAQCFLEMIERGYTSVAEFHYLHRDVKGERYEVLSELSQAVINAALSVGLPITHLPVLYRWSGVGAQPLREDQRRFELSLDEYSQMISELDSLYHDVPTVQVGIAPHSLRAVSPEELELIADPSFCPSLHGKDRPLHIHISEQQAEVNMWLELTGQRPVEWLLNCHELNSRWCLVHATHINEKETTRLARTGAIAGLCPSTEADLGDGIFPLVDFLNQGGQYGIGSDSNLRIDLSEELRLLEWGQRLKHEQRNLALSRSVEGRISSHDQKPNPYESLGQSMLLASAQGGGRATQRETGFKIGAHADWFTLNNQDMGLVNSSGYLHTDQWLFASRDSRVKDVFINGQRVLSDGYHPLRTQINQSFVEAIKRLYQS